MKALLRKVDPAAITDDWPSSKKGIVEPLQKLIETSIFMFENGITVADNMNAAIVDIESCVHGVEQSFKPPKKMQRPLTFVPIRATLADGTILPVVPQVSPINFARADAAQGLLGLTAQYAPPLGYAKYYRSAAFNAANGDNIVDLDATEFVQGGIVYTAGTGIVMPTAGIVRVDYSCEWTAAAGGTFRLIYVSSGGNIYADERDGPNVPFGGSGSTLLQIAAGNGIALRTGQDSGGAIALTVGSRRINMSAQYVAPDPATTARVTGILVGA